MEEAAAFLRAYAFGKVVASRADMLTFMADPVPHAEASVLHFKAAVHAKMVGVQAMTRRAMAVKTASVPQARRAFPLFVMEQGKLQRGQGTRQDHQDELKRLSKAWAAMPASAKETYKFRSKEEFQAQRAALRAQGMQRRIGSQGLPLKGCQQEQMHAHAGAGENLVYGPFKVQACSGKDRPVLGMGTYGKVTSVAVVPRSSTKMSGISRHVGNTIYVDSIVSGKDITEEQERTCAPCDDDDGCQAARPWIERTTAAPEGMPGSWEEPLARMAPTPTQQDAGG
eukprot:Skav218633  [mRNA]  locus=scaffold365:213062:219205:+ [translate_table: standard]